VERLEITEEEKEKLREIFINSEPLCDCERCFENWLEVYGERILYALDQDRPLSTENWELFPQGAQSERSLT